MELYLPPRSVGRVRALVAVRFPEAARHPAFPRIIQTACRLDLSMAQKISSVGKLYRRTMIAAVLEAEREAQTLDLAIKRGRQ